MQMRIIELSTILLKSYKLTLCEGKAVVRNQKRINGLIGVRANLIPEKYHNLLANATFVGNAVNESIVWTTDVFSNNPTRLSDLNGEDYDKYAQILCEALFAYANAFKDAENSVKDLLYASITYPSESSIFCSDDRVVITDWGMSPKGAPATIGMPTIIDDVGGKSISQDVEFSEKVTSESEKKTDDNRQDDTIPNNDSIKNTPEQDTIDSDNSENVVDDSVIESYQHNEYHEHDDSRNDKPANNEEFISDDSIEKHNNVIISQERSVSDSESTDGNIITDNVTSKTDKSKSNRSWWWILLIALLLLLMIVLMSLLRGCSSTIIEPVSPAIDSTQVVLSDDSLRYIASNRLLLLLTKDGVNIDDFAKRFRQIYKDEKKYILSNPDTIVRRLTLTFPADEKNELEERLPNEFSEFGLIVIPETMYKGSYISNDPDLSDVSKRWYFDECSVFDAWDVTMGNEDLVVAVIDDGFDLNHPELNGKIVDPFNAVNHSSTITPSPDGHGTHVAATAVGMADNSSGVAGVAPKCKFMPIQVGDEQGNMAMSAVLDAVIYAINSGADVVNMSLGMAFGPFVQFAPLYIQKNFRASMFLEEERVWNHLFNIAHQRNIVFVLAGGNENCLIGLDPMQRSQNTIKVSAVQQGRQKAAFSNYGDYSTLSAPGVRIYNAIPGNRFTYMDGTSMAAPIVTGGCALLKSNNPGMSFTEMVQLLRQTGIPSPSDVGPIVNFARALKVEHADMDECSSINERYNELLTELERLKKEYPDCIQKPDTFSIPKDVSVDQLIGRWKSTTSLINMNNDNVVVYFTFNGTSIARLDIVEPSGTTYSANLKVSVANDQIFLDQLLPATNSSVATRYNPYTFVLRPNYNRKAEGLAKNKVEVANAFNFNLIKI